MKIIFLLSIFFLFFITFTKSSQNPISFNYPSFNQNDISLFADSTLDQGSIKLTNLESNDTYLPAGPDSVGQVVNKVFLTSSPSSSISFFTNFSFSISKVPNPKYTGNGFAFFFTPDSLQFKHPPVERFGLPKRFLAFVIDTTTTKNEDLDVVAHISVNINNPFKPLISAPISEYFLSISNGEIYYTWIEYHSQSNNFSVFMNNTNIKPPYPVLFGTMDLSGYFKNYPTLYFGFSAFSLAHSGIYEIHSWDFTAIFDEFHKNRNILKIVLPSVAAGLFLIVLIVICIRYCHCITSIWSLCCGPLQGFPGAVEMVP